MSEMSTALERKILQNIFTNYNDKTIIVISHRLDNADLYDKVIMLDNLKSKRRKGGIMIILKNEELNNVYGGGLVCG